MGGLPDDEFALLYNINTPARVAIKTLVRRTNRRNINNSIIQGDVFGPMFCGKHLDRIGKKSIEHSKYTYNYKGIDH